MANIESTPQLSLSFATRTTETSEVKSAKAKPHFLKVMDFHPWERYREPQDQPLGVEDSNKRPNPMPQIRLQARWLEHAGFLPGDRVRIDVLAPGQLSISRLSGEETA